MFCSTKHFRQQFLAQLSNLSWVAFNFPLDAL